MAAVGLCRSGEDGQGYAGRAIQPAAASPAEISVVGLRALDQVAPKRLRSLDALVAEAANGQGDVLAAKAKRIVQRDVQ